MSKAHVEIEIPDGYELAEPVMRVPRDGDFYLSSGDVVKRQIGDGYFRRAILKPTEAVSTMKE